MRLRLPNIDQMLFREDRFVTTVKRGFYVAVVAVLLAVIAVLISSMRTIPNPPNTTEDFNRLNRVQFFAQNFVTLWLTGTAADATTMKAMVTSPDIIPATWSTDPLDISNINVADIEANTIYSGTTQWVVTVGVTLTPPGSDQPQRSYFATTVMDRPGTTIKALTLPRIVNIARPTITVDGDYTHPVNTATPLAQAVANFANAYYTAQTGSLGRFVSSDFHADPIVNSPYTGVELLALRAHDNVPATAAPGTTLDVMATIKASISLTTFQTLNVPLTMKAIDRNQWVVDALPTLSWFGDSATTTNTQPGG